MVSIVSIITSSIVGSHSSVPHEVNRLIVIIINSLKYLIKSIKELLIMFPLKSVWEKMIKFTTREVILMTELYQGISILKTIKN